MGLAAPVEGEGGAAPELEPELGPWARTREEDAESAAMTARCSAVFILL